MLHLIFAIYTKEKACFILVQKKTLGWERWSLHRIVFHSSCGLQQSWKKLKESMPKRDKINQCEFDVMEYLSLIP